MSMNPQGRKRSRDYKERSALTFHTDSQVAFRRTAMREHADRRRLAISLPAKADVGEVLTISPIQHFALTASGDVKPLRGVDGSWRLRVGDYRTHRRRSPSQPGLSITLLRPHARYMPSDHRAAKDIL
jgi:hypothetical protein